MVGVEVDDGVDVDVAAVERDATAVLRHVGRAEAELSVLLCADRTIGPLNRQWRGKDRPTDVLSFPQGGELLGDVVISVETAARQAAERGHSTAHEIRVLLVHGICHLLGHDHEDDAEAEVMEALEREILAAL